MTSTVKTQGKFAGIADRVHYWTKWADCGERAARAPIRMKAQNSGGDSDGQRMVQKGVALSVNGVNG